MENPENVENPQNKFRTHRPPSIDEEQDDHIGRLEARVCELEKHFSHGGRVWALENQKLFFSGLACAFTGTGAFTWYLIERFLEALHKP